MFHVNHYIVLVMYIINNFKIKCSCLALWCVNHVDVFEMYILNQEMD